MRLLADENIPLPSVHLLRQAGHAVEAVAEFALDGAEQPRLHLAPGSPDTRIRLSLRETPIKFRPLLLRGGQRRRIRSDAIPDILDELDTLGDTELSDFGERIDTHS